MKVLTVNSILTRVPCDNDVLKVRGNDKLRQTRSAKQPEDKNTKMSQVEGRGVVSKARKPINRLVKQAVVHSSLTALVSLSGTHREFTKIW